MCFFMISSFHYLSYHILNELNAIRMKLDSIQEKISMLKYADVSQQKMLKLLLSPPDELLLLDPPDEFPGSSFFPRVVFWSSSAGFIIIITSLKVVLCQSFPHTD